MCSVAGCSFQHYGHRCCECYDYWIQYLVLVVVVVAEEDSRGARISLMVSAGLFRSF